MEPWMNVVLGIVASAFYAGLGKYKAAGEPTDPRKMAQTIAIGFAVSIGLSLFQLFGFDQNQAYQYVMLILSMAGLTVITENAAKGTARRRELSKKASDGKTKKKKLKEPDEKPADSEE